MSSGNETTLQNDDATITFPNLAERAAILHPGAHLGRYRLTRFLGRGGFGEVWEAEDAGAGRHLALKILTQLRSASREVLERFHREGQLAASLNHPRSVFVFGAEEIEGHPVIAMELMPGGTLQDQLQLRGKLPVRHAVDYILDIIEGLEAAQDAGIVHRDVKPSNCFVDEEGRAKIGDFGISKTLEPQHSLTFAEAFVGTPAYASPEQIRGRDVDFRSDIYSVGATLYSLLTGKPPFEGGTAGELLARILSEEPVPIASRQIQVPKKVARIVSRCMAKDREKRYPSYAALRADLLPFSSLYLLTAGNLAKRVTAFVIDEVAVALTLSTGIHAAGSGWQFETAYNISHLLYYVIPEAFWGRSLGKHLMGLSVVGASGVAMTFRQALLRTFAFGGILLPAALLELSTGPAPLLTLVTMLTLIITMRRENGFAGPHELISATRVIARAAALAGRRQQQRSADLRVALAEERPASFGPYRALKDLWRKDTEALVLAFDQVLRRNVWVHVNPVNQSLDGLALVRSGKLRWLQGGTQGGLRWEAFEAPHGTSFYEWVRSKERLSWAEARRVLLGITEEIETRLKLHGRGVAVSLSHIWIDPQGEPKLLEFPAFIDGRETLDSSIIDGYRATQFLHQIARFSLTGEIVPLDHLGGAPPAVPLPEHARTFVARLCRPGSASPSIGEIQFELRRLTTLRAEIKKPARAGMLAAVAAVPVVVLLFYAFGPVVKSLQLPAWQRDFQQLGKYDALLKDLEAMGNVPEAREPREAVCRLFAWIHREAMSAPGGRALLAQVRTFQREKLESCRKQYPSMTPAAAMEARDVIDARCSCVDRAGETTGSEQAGFRRSVGRLFIELNLRARFIALERGITLMFWAGGFLWIFPVLLALLCPPGLMAHVFGFRLQTSTGTPAGRFRSATRSMVSWLPFALFFPIVAVTGFLGYAPDAKSYWATDGVAAVTFRLQGYAPVLATIELALGAVIVGGMIYAVAKPDRGLPDLLAGTHVVPK